ncbi:hypothetical protein G3M48_008453 [Beauveria asiatica]|uniref:LPXTG-domain-containing protein n=1 Tax=Beauveria asiatica TaxID=1069075 RepID=A0AAW0RKR9_9HYPO
MNFSIRTSYLIALVSTALSADALQVAPGSPCAHKCLGSPSDNNWSASDSNTNSSEITCFDDQFSSTKVGLKYKQCQECLQTSTRGNWGETDAKWFVYNARFALDVCLFHTPKASDDKAVSSCSTDQACESLKKGLTYDDLPDTQNTTWNYCFDDNGAFMGSERAKCMQCLRDSQNQTYLANFITALEAGCRQTPEKGTAIGLSGTIFTNRAVQITDPNDTPHPDNDKSHGLATGAIIGIAVAVIILILIAVGLLLYYCARERESINWEQDYYDADTPPNDSIFAARYDMTQARLRAEQQQQQAEAAAKFQYLRYHENSLSLEKPRTFNTSGDYYDHMERCQPTQGQDQPRGRSAYRMDDLSPTAHKRSSTATLPSHHAVKRDPSSSGTVTESRSGSAVVTTRRRLSPPASVHQPVRSNTPDSFAVQAYLDAAAESARMAAVAAATANPASISSMPANSPRSSKRRSMLSIFSLRSGGSNMSKKSKMSFARSSSQQHPPSGYIFQPPLTSDKAFHGDKGISRPILAREEPRFLQAGIAGRPNSVAPSKAPPRPPSPADKYAEYGEVPLRSGKEDLYGM